MVDYSYDRTRVVYYRDILTRCLLQLREKLIHKLMKNGLLRAQNGLQFQKKNSATMEKIRTIYCTLIRSLN